MCLSDSNAKCGRSAPRSHRRKAVLSPVALTPRLSGGAPAMVSDRPLQPVVMRLRPVHDI